MPGRKLGDRYGVYGGETFFGRVVLDLGAAFWGREYGFALAFAVEDLWGAMRGMVVML